MLNLLGGGLRCEKEILKGSQPRWQAGNFMTSLVKHWKAMSSASQHVPLGTRWLWTLKWIHALDILGDVKCTYIMWAWHKAMHICVDWHTFNLIDKLTETNHVNLTLSINCIVFTVLEVRNWLTQRSPIYSHDSTPQESPKKVSLERKYSIPI